MDVTDSTSNAAGYRSSHAAPGYGEIYEKTYEHGYYADQWRLIEAPLVKRVFEAFKRSKPTARYLDFACGTGRILKLAENVFDDCTGVDVSPAMLKLARKSCSKSRIIEQDITRKPLDERFDLISAFRFFLNAEPEMADEVLQQMHTLLNDDGMLVLNIHVNSASPLGVFYQIREKFLTSKWATVKSLDEITAALEKNGFRIETVTWYGFLPRPGWQFESLTRRLMMPVEKLCQRIPFMEGKAQCFLLTCRKG